MTSKLPFHHNTYPTVGAELELQLVDLHTFNLTMESDDFLRRLSEVNVPSVMKPEITKSMIELNSCIHSSYESLLKELQTTRDILVNEASQAHIGICGGGTHPYQKWSEQRIFMTERFAGVSEQYGYLAKQFTVFGQHIHIGCENGNDALYLCHAFARYLPHFVAINASSPFSQGVDTAFDCSRLAVVSAFPLSGTPPWTLEWEEFELYFDRMFNMGIVSSMKDFYWDIRPKPEFGTIEIRICDTPLTVEIAADISAYAQMLSQWLLDERKELSRDVYLTYLMNRFRSSRYGLDAVFIDPIAQKHIPIAEDITRMVHILRPYADKFGSAKALENIMTLINKKQNGSAWLRRVYRQTNSLRDVVRQQQELWSQV